MSHHPTLLQWEEKLYLNMPVENPLSATDTYLITVRERKKQKFKYDMGVDFIQIRVLLQPKKN